MKAPRFWSNPPGRPGLAAHLLASGSVFWRFGAALRAIWSKPKTAPVPVLCVGNLVAGGAGKTPMVAALAGRLAAKGCSPAIVTRGHGGRITGPHRVDLAHDTFADVGDEPLVLAATTPVWVSRDRAAGAVAAAEDGADIVLLDDGFQNPGLVKDASLLMIDAATGFGNGRVIPAGPLREPVRDGLARADAAVLVGAQSAADRTLALWPDLKALPLIRARMQPVQTGLSLSHEPVVAFAGIGRPEKFFTTLREMGADLVETHGFPDHHVYPAAILKRLIHTARQRDAMLVTTEKDAVRLPPAFRREVMVVQVTLELDDWTGVDAILDRLCRISP
ncbi:MAG: tetraacyldisaccharide 4'-kinase [Pseudomonadota bacterium]